MQKYFCDYCGLEITGNSVHPCESCIETLKAALIEKRDRIKLPFGKIVVSLPSTLLGDSSDTLMHLWFADVLPKLREFGAAVSAEDATRSATEKGDLLDNKEQV